MNNLEFEQQGFGLPANIVLSLYCNIILLFIKYTNSYVWDLVKNNIATTNWNNRLWTNYALFLSKVWKRAYVLIINVVKHGVME